ncbi:penicillin-binding protein activator [Pseudooceanicola sp. MF1-13]|uniref:penicillin-binding protein activator n=1 Tax=Pseudooceanicola sp. MF1-13 TaxID=3379095 RepID=UPI0038918AE7
MSSSSLFQKPTLLRPSRRNLLRAMAATSVATATTGCGALEGMSDAVSRSPSGPARSALLLPLSGSAADLGQLLKASATLGGGPGIGIDIYDSGSEPQSAAAAAQTALDAGAQVLVGPVFSAQAEAVAKVAPRSVPVVTLSNNVALAGSGVFVFGITAVHSARAVLSLAAQRGLRDLAIVVPPGDFGSQAIAATTGAAQALGIQVRTPLVRSSASGLVDALKSGGGLPDAVYLPAADGTLRPFVGALSGQGMQLLGSTQWSALDLDSDRAFRDAWFAAPDPLRFAPFKDAFAKEAGTQGGIITGLAYDGTELLRVLGQRGQQSRRGLLDKDGFNGVLGPYRFLDNGQCERGLAVLQVGAGDFSLIGSTSV